MRESRALSPGLGNLKDYPNFSLAAVFPDLGKPSPSRRVLNLQDLHEPQILESDIFFS
jgi:hypothetical protein